jgi:lysozyme family protein
MANFLEAYNITCAHEGGYVNDPDDVGGETYKGISRKYNPSWKGWLIIDQLKTEPNFPQTAYDSVPLNAMVGDFYKANYWDVNLLDQFDSQNLGNEMFDTGVNMGISRAAKFLQQSLNYLNKNGSLYADITADGKIGKNTLAALDACMGYQGDSYIYKILNLLQGNHYLDYMSDSPSQEKYAYGWLKRVDFIKH